MAQVAPALADEHCCIAVDLPLGGRSVGRLVLTSCDAWEKRLGHVRAHRAAHHGLLPDGLRTDAGVRRDFAALLRSARKADCVRASESVAQLHRPALVAWAADDKLFPRALGKRPAQLLPQGRFALVERSRTFVPEDNPGALVDLLRDFLA